MFRSARFWAGVAISAVFIALFLRATHPREIADAFGEANYLYVAPAIVVLFVALWLRCLRWSVLMRPIATIAPLRLFSYAIIGYMANNLLPARAGEIVRAYVLGDRENVSKVGTLGTIAVERLFDGVTLVILFLTAGAIVGFGDDSRMQVIAVASSALFVAALAVFYWATASTARAQRLLHAIFRILPERLEPRAEEFVVPLVAGLRSVHDLRAMSMVAALSAAAWTVEASAYAIIGVGFDLGVGFGEYCLLLSAANLAIIIPTFFGGTGPFEWAAKLVLTSAGVAGGLAGAYAIIAHAVIFIPTTIVGLVLLWTFGISFGRLQTIKVPVEEQEVAVP